MPPLTFLQISVLEQPVFEPRYLNMEYLFNKILQIARAIHAFFTDGGLSLGGPAVAPDWEVLSLAGWTIAGALALLV